MYLDLTSIINAGIKCLYLYKCMWTIFKKRIKNYKIGPKSLGQFCQFQICHVHVPCRYLKSRISQATLYLAEVGHWTVSEFERSPSTTSFYFELVCSCVHIEVKSLKVAFLSSTKVRSFFTKVEKFYLVFNEAANSLGGRGLKLFFPGL